MNIIGKDWRALTSIEKLERLATEAENNKKRWEKQS